MKLYLHYDNSRRGRERARCRINIKQKWLKTSQAWEERWTYRSMKHRISQIGWIQIGIQGGILIKLSKIKGKKINFNSSKSKESSYIQGTIIRLSADPSKRTFQARRKWDDIQNTEVRYLSTKNDIPSESLLQKWRRDKEFPKQKLKEFIITKCAL